MLIQGNSLVSDRDALKQQVCDVIESRRERVVGVGESIMDAPELGFKEYQTAEKVQVTLQSDCTAGVTPPGFRRKLEQLIDGALETRKAAAAPTAVLNPHLKYSPNR